MFLKVIKLLCVVQGNIRARDSALWQKLLVFDTMTFGAGHDVGGHVNQALLEYMKNYMSEFNEQVQELCSRNTRRINDVFVTEE